ncbi:MAG: hypothetical protein AMS27_08780 [Bacteroides sp. SM23_62_1]|nr:MAG: hypothetical protein AMS27_08780 [Bacteroides sp. SM23_62_1]
MNKTFLIVPIFCFYSLQAIASDYYVDAVGGSDATGNGTQGNPWKTITYALSKISGTGHTLHVAAGTYDASLGETFPILMENGVSLAGTGAEVSIINANEAGRVIQCISITDTSTRIEGFTIMGGSNSEGGGGIYVSAGSCPRITGNIIKNNTVPVARVSVTPESRLGGGIYILNSSPEITGNQIIDNWTGALDLTNTGSGGWGGGIAVSGSASNPVIQNNTITGNKAINTSYASAFGGGIYIGDGASGTIVNNTISANFLRQLSATSGATYGGGIYISGSGTPVILDNVISNNTASAMYGSVSECSGIFIDGCCPTITKNVIAGNDYNGISISSSASPAIINNTISENSENGINISSLFPDSILNNIITLNSGYGIYESNSDSDPGKVCYNLFYANGSGLYFDEGSTDYYTVGSMNSEVTECENNIDGDPLFVDRLNGDYRIKPGSPAIDAGHPDPTYDDPDDTRADIGAHYIIQGFFIDISLVPQDEYSGDIDVSYSIYNSYGTNVGLACEYKDTSDAEWNSAIITGDTSQLTQDNYAGTITWNSKNDLPDKDLAGVKFRIIPYSSTMEGEADSTGIFKLDNSHNHSIEIELTYSLSEYTDSVHFNISLSDITNDILSIKGMYKTSYGDWLQATIIGKTSNIDTSKYINTLIWDSRTDLGNADIENVKLRIVPSDGWTDGTSDSTNTFHVDNNIPPSVIIPDLIGEQNNDIEIQFTLTDAENDILSIISEYSKDTGNNWLPATVTGKITDISDYSGILTWHSYSDLPGIASGNILFRITPQDIDSGLSDTITLFLDNNIPPSVEIIKLTGEQNEDVTISYILSDTENDTLKIFCEYYDDNASEWIKATITGDTSGIVLYEGNITWSTLVDLPTTAAYVKFRITPYDTEQGTADTTEFILDNVGVPILLFNAPIEGEQSGDIVFEYTIDDDEKDPVSLTPEYSTDSGNNWHRASTSGDTIDIDSDHYSGSIIWHSETDLQGLDLFSVRFRIIPRDDHTGISEITQAFHLDNNHIPWLALNQLIGIQRGSIEIGYTLHDDENDMLSIFAEYSTLSVPAYTKATITGDTANIDNSKYSGSITWKSFTDMSGMTDTVIFRLTVMDTDTGLTDTVHLFLDNNIPLPEVNSPAPYCDGDTIAGISATGTNIRWYSDAGLDTLLATGNTFNPADTLVGTYYYYVTQSEEENESLPDTVTLIIYPTPSSPAADDISICFGEAPPPLSATGSNIRWYNNAGLTNLVYTGNMYETGLSSAGEYSFYVTQSEGICESQPNNVILSINQLPAVVIQEPDENPVELSHTVTLTVTGAENYLWSPSTSLSSDSEPSVVASPDSSITYYVTGIDKNGCEAFDSIRIYVLCDPCTTEQLLSNTEGTFNHGCINRSYNNNAHCSWIIYPSGAHEIYLSFNKKRIDISAGDALWIYWGSMADNSYLIGKYNNSSLPPDTIHSPHPSMLIEFYSDNTVVGDGFQVSYWTDLTPGYNNYEANYQLKIYPNPFTHSTIIEFPNPLFEPYKFILTDISGKIQRIIGDITESRYKLDRGNLEKGLYFVELFGNQVFRGIVIIE